jgi:DedD protein
MDRRVKERLIGATILVALIVLIVPELLSGPKPAPVPPLAAGLPSSTRNVSVNLATSKTTAEPQAADAATVGAAARETPRAAGARAPGSSASGASASTVGGAAPQGASAEPSAPGASGAGADAGAPGSSAAAASSAWSAPTVATLKAQEPAPLETAVSSPRSAVENAAGADAAHGHRGWAVQLGSFASKANAEKLLHQLPGSGFYLVSSGAGPSLRYRVRMGPLADRGAAERAVTKLKAEGHAATIVTPAS